jgi:monolysocardiolipin acyltransferase
MGMTGVLSKCFLYGFNRVEVTGLSRFLDILDSRRDPANRQRGLLTGGTINQLARLVPFSC